MPLLGAADETTSLDVEIQGIRSAKGKVYVALWASSDGFPDDDHKAFQTQMLEAREGKVTLTFAGLRPGSYAISAYHDENSNGKLDKNMLGIPKDGYGFSRDARAKMSAPKFDAAVFEARGARAKTTFSIQY